MSTDNELISFIKNCDNYKFACLLKNQTFKKKLIENNFFWENNELFINRYGENMFISCINTLIETNPHFINNNIYKFLENKYSDDFYQQLFEIYSSNNIEEYYLVEILINNRNPIIFKYWFIMLLISDRKYCKIFSDNFNFIMNNTYDLLKIKQEIPCDTKLFLRFNNIIENNKDKVIYGMLMDGFELSLSTIKQEKIFNTLKIIVEELMQNEGKEYKDINKIGSGGYSSVYSIGNKVLKIGVERDNFKIRNNKRFLKPLLRINIDSLYQKDVLGCIEITERVNTENITREDAYKLYKEVRELNLVWFDCSVRNVGRLNRKNKIYWNEHLDPIPSAVGYTNECDEELEKGELVIIDNDFIYPESANNSLEYSYLLAEIFEERYQKEKINHNQKIKKH